MKPAFAVAMADLAFILFLNAPSEECGPPVGLQVEHSSSNRGLLDPVRVERAYARLVATSAGGFRPELVYAGHIVTLSDHPNGTALEGAAQASIDVGRVLSSLGAPPDVRVVFQLVLPGSVTLRETTLLHAQAKELGLDCEVVSRSRGRTQ